MTLSASRLPAPKTARRIFGLDVVRATAVSLVVVGHMLQHSKPPLPVKWFGRLGVLGVELFFVLSGFLIGGILIRLIRRGELSTPRDLVRFWSRRWLRTLPLYYLFFFIYLRWDWTGPSRLADHLDFLVFLQNFAWRGPDFFLLSWSLTIEEYFYLLFPLAYYGLLRLVKDPVRSLVLSLSLFLLGPLLLKFWLAPFPGWDAFNDHIRMVTVTRLDSLMYGVGAAFVKDYLPGVWSRLRRAASLTLPALGLVALYIYFDVPGLGTSRLMQTFFFPVISLSVALTLPFFDDIREPAVAGTSLFRPARQLITWLATISYSVYLGHILVITIVNQTLGAIPGGMTVVYPRPMLLYPIYFVLIVLFTPLTYYGWELPFLRLRDRGGLFRGHSLKQAEPA